MKCSPTTLNKLLCLALLLSCLPVAGQEFQADLSVRVTSAEFFDGIEPGESGLLQFHVTNHGPDPITNPDAELSVMPGFNVTQDYWVYELLLNSPLSESHCSYTWRHIDPRPPVNNIMYVQSFTVHGPLAVNQTKTCTLNLTFELSGQLETVWWLPFAPQFDPVQSNNYYPFEFRGQIPAVPLHIGFVLIVLMGLIGLWALFRTRHAG